MMRVDDETGPQATVNQAGRQAGSPTVSVVVASIEASVTIAASLARFVEEAGMQGEVILVDASRDGTADRARDRFPGLRILRKPPGRLAPELWRDGLNASDAPLVAFSTAQMIPARGWLESLRGCLESTGAAAVGGPIDPAPRLSAVDRAVYLLRYVNYLKPLPSVAQTEPPGDNALYRRDALVGLETVWEAGFWEVEIHRRLRDRGATLGMANEAVVEFQGGGGLGLALRQRRDHARHYGAARGGRMTRAERLMRSAAAPLVPALLIRRITAALAQRGRGIGPWLSALPSLSLLLAAWSAGETTGTWLGPPARGRTVA
ncbi:Glycosyl transferase family 2 [Singulisphaera sp. GP187]|uniref:glycosyltransferase n=1 Tax=Singulisphaera sp. GP187 TaxID=1882752 RepID=UPI00092819E0|nr:glycosyltransferase [Singulisphaera sp. GP187]SIO15282.1 Glycosyl transferase family 2 [Singulisphaera sp. GP187]